MKKIRLFLLDDIWIKVNYKSFNTSAFFHC